MWLQPSLCQVMLWLAVLSVMVALVLRDYTSDLVTRINGSRDIAMVQSLARGAGYGLISRAGTPAWWLPATSAFTPLRTSGNSCVHARSLATKASNIGHLPNPDEPEPSRGMLDVDAP